MKFPLIIASVLLLCMHAEAQFIHIGLFNDQVISSAVISCASGKYNIESDEGIVGFLDEGDNMFVKLENDSITLYDSQLIYGRFTNLKLTYI